MFVLGVMAARLAHVRLYLHYSLDISSAMELEPCLLDVNLSARIEIHRAENSSGAQIDNDRRDEKLLTSPPIGEPVDNALLSRHASDDSLEPRRRNRIAVVGLYNSGSTAVAGVLSSLGVHFGNTSWAYEDESMASFLAKAWDEPWGDAKIFSHEQRVQRLRDWMVNWEASTNSTLLGLKHPLLSLSGLDVLTAWGNETTFVWAHRPLKESIAGLNRRSWFDYTVSTPEANTLRAQYQTKLWRSLRAFFECGPDGSDDPGAAAADAASCRAHRPLVVSYSELLRDPDEVVLRIANALGLDRSAEEISNAAATVDTASR